jgi:hypothetical protein
MDVFAIEDMAQSPGTQQALGAEDQNQHQEQVRQDRRNLRQRQPQHGPAEGGLIDLMAHGGEQAGQRPVQRHGKGLHHADQQRGHESPGQRTHAADHHHHENDGAHGGRHGGLGHIGVAADHAGQAGQRAAAAKHQHEHARHVVAQRLHHFGVLERGLNHQADACARQQQPDGHQHQQRHQHHKGARLGELCAIQGKQRPLQRRWQRIRHGAAPQTSCTTSRIR